VAPVASHADAQPAGGSAREPRASCLREIERLRVLPALPGAPDFERSRAQVLARAKAEPVLFMRTPKHTSGETFEVEHYRAQLERSPAPAFALYGMYRHFWRRPEVARAVLLRQGYLYADSPGLALGLVERVRLRHLFREPELFIQRGSETWRVVKRGRYYEYAEGARRGERAHLLLLDRVWASGSEPGPPLHVALRWLAESTGADRIRVERLTEEGIVAELRYGSVWVPSVLATSQARASLRCEAVAAGAEPVVRDARDFLLRRHRVLRALRAAIDRQVHEQLPFDEPRSEVGQQDGNLRPAWRQAYQQGLLSYRFNEEHYRVFDSQGRPLPPQVCIDFITDTLERASGTWWPALDTGRPSLPLWRERTPGNLDFERLGISNRRSVGVFVDFAWEHPEWFDAYDLAPEERVPFGWRERFYQHLYEHRDRYVPGDIVTVHGRRDDEELHYHSFFIYDADPLTGMPTLLAANAGRPRIRTWDQELRSAPRRSIRSRIRPRLGWLEALVVPQDQQLVADERAASATPG
jgi:hypothetical protein